ncbi:acyl-CoA thioesterase [Altererythrobacter sp. SALINAS58]|uniref:acyl-CoA thioesterase n=1 Tax=Alteripontixanthobacter muriae TaxID=2705546 RepID=UPI00157573C5|nr:acyl-CoA thioesterase [Alteripontixanthobacter muriae]
MSARFTRRFEAKPEHIDELGHVNNIVWLGWAQDIATSHWKARADPAHVEAYFWVVTRHEVDYRGNIGAGEAVTAETWIPDAPRGARFDRCVSFSDDAGKVLVSVRSTWAMLDKASGRLVRIRPDVAAAFFAEE